MVYLFVGTAYQLDITKQIEVEVAVSKIVAEYNGRLDIFIANSGISWGEAAALDSSVSHYHEVLGTNLDGVYYSAIAAGKHWRRQAKEGTSIDGRKLDNFRLGSFIATASMSGHIVNVPHIQAAYNVSKAGVIHLCKHTQNKFLSA
jgi:sorbose reductase